MNNRIDAIYARQSVDKKDSISIESQIEFCKYELKGGNCKEYTDKGYSGKNTDRPKFQELVRDIKRGLIAKVVVYKLDRISRSILDCALPGFVDSKNEEKTERNAGYLVVSHSGGGMLRQGTRKGIRRTPANRGMRAHWVVKGLDISEDVCHGMCP